MVDQLNSILQDTFGYTLYMCTFVCIYIYITIYNLFINVFIYVFIHKKWSHMRAYAQLLVKD